MKLRSLVFGFCIGLCSFAFAANQHLHPQANNTDGKPAEKQATYPGYCEIEVINDSFSTVRVYGVFDDGSPLLSFNIYSFESPHYISLYYYYYCHAGMNLYVDSWTGYHIYAAYTPTGSTVRIVPYLTNQQKAELTAK